MTEAEGICCDPVEKVSFCPRPLLARPPHPTDYPRADSEIFRMGVRRWNVYCKTCGNMDGCACGRTRGPGPKLKNDGKPCLCGCENPAGCVCGQNVTRYCPEPRPKVFPVERDPCKCGNPEGCDCCRWQCNRRVFEKEHEITKQERDRELYAKALPTQPTTHKVKKPMIKPDCTCGKPICTCHKMLPVDLTYIPIDEHYSDKPGWAKRIPYCNCGNPVQCICSVTVPPMPPGDEGPPLNLKEKSRAERSLLFPRKPKENEAYIYRDPTHPGISQPECPPGDCLPPGAEYTKEEILGKPIRPDSPLVEDKLPIIG